jgi:superfamily II DNA/RNA helicase
VLLAQAAVLPQALACKNVVVAAETGSGKTLAYLTPIVHNILARRITEADDEPDDPNARRRFVP